MCVEAGEHSLLVATLGTTEVRGWTLPEFIRNVVISFVPKPHDQTG
jgi:hypothetical protein